MNRRLKALETLRRIEERQLDEISRTLCAARDEQHKALSHVEHLHQRAAHEASSSVQEALPYIGQFLLHLRREQTHAMRHARSLDGTIEELHEQVVERFTSEKTYSTLKGQLLDKIKLAREAKDEAQLNDITNAKFIRSLAS